MPIKRIEAIKRFFNTPSYPPIENSELLALVREDKEAYNEISDLCAIELGETIEEPTTPASAKPTTTEA
jgi:hypothetical protein